MVDRTQLTVTEIERLVAEHPGLPSAYLDYLRDAGWGTAPSGHMIYSGPIALGEVYPHLSGEEGRVLLGDDFQGFCLGCDLSSQQFGEYSDDGEWVPFDEGFDLAAYLASP